MDDKTIGVITEQGDLGLGFNPITDEEKKKLKAKEEEKTEEKQSK